MSSSCSSSLNNNKRRRSNNKISTIFKNPKDEKQCISLIDVLNSCIQIEIDRYILKEIAEFSTGILIKCKHDLHKSIPHIDNFWIHHLRGNNFDKDNKENYENELLLYNYQCEEQPISHVVHVFECKTCDKTSQISRVKQNSWYQMSRFNSSSCDIYPYRVCSEQNCHGIYCPKCYSNSGIHCNACVNYYCNDCKLSGCHCAHCSEYYCENCAHFIIDDEDDLPEHCVQCSWVLHGETIVIDNNEEELNS